MGAVMRAGKAEIFTKRECWLVSGWCHQFDRAELTLEEKMDRVGVFDFSASVVAEANTTVPQGYDAAQVAGFAVEDRETFASARGFLTKAAGHPDGITGSY